MVDLRPLPRHCHDTDEWLQVLFIGLHCHGQHERLNLSEFWLCACIQMPIYVYQAH